MKLRGILGLQREEGYFHDSLTYVHESTYLCIFHTQKYEPLNDYEVNLHIYAHYSGTMFEIVFVVYQ